MMRNRHPSLRQLPDCCPHHPDDHETVRRCLYCSCKKLVDEPEPNEGHVLDASCWCKPTVVDFSEGDRP